MRPRCGFLTAKASGMPGRAAYHVGWPCPVRLSPVSHHTCGGITYIFTWEGWLYLATVIDCATPMIIGWAMDDNREREVGGVVLGRRVEHDPGRELQAQRRRVVGELPGRPTARRRSAGSSRWRTPSPRWSGSLQGTAAGGDRDRVNPGEVPQAIVGLLASGTRTVLTVTGLSDPLCGRQDLASGDLAS